MKINNQFIVLFVFTVLVIQINCNEQQITDQERQDIKHQKEQWGPLGGAFLANIFSEFGDKTFIIAAILAIKYSRLTVFLGAAGALIFMTFLACAVGNYLPALLSPQITSLIAAVILTIFGCKMLYEAYKDEDDSDEEKEIEQELMEMEKQLEGEKLKQSPKKKGSSENLESPQKKQRKQIPFLSKKNFLILTASFSQVFFGEWGDRSQITTLILASDNDAFLVFIGASLGQGLCTVLAVLGGRWLAKSVSERYLSIGGGVLMLLFAINSYYKAFN